MVAVTPGNNSVVQNAAVRAPVENNIAFREQNTQRQRADEGRTQPRQAPSAESQNTQATTSRRDVNQTDFSTNESPNGAFLASSSESFATGISSGQIDSDAPRGSLVDILA